MLIGKLGKMGLHQQTISWFNSYLTERVQRNRINDHCFTYRPVPQGSILGPTLFSLYINNLVHFVDCDLIFYADDMVILDKNPILLQHNLNQIYAWCNQNFLTINCKNTQWMKTCLKGKSNLVDVRFELGGVGMDMVDEYRYFGVQIDSHLNFYAHRRVLINSVNYKLTFSKKSGNISLWMQQKQYIKAQFYL